MDAYSAPTHDSLAASEASETGPLGPPDANRHRLPDERPAITHHFAVGGHEGYLTVGLYPNGQPGEIFIRMAKEGSTIAGLVEVECRKRQQIEARLHQFRMAYDHLDA